MIDMREHIAVQEERIAELTRGSVAVRTPQPTSLAPPGMTPLDKANEKVTILERQLITHLGSKYDAEQDEVGSSLKIAALGRALRRKMTDSEGGDLDSFVAALVRTLTKSCALELVPILAKKALRSHRDTPSARSVKEGNAERDKLVMALLEAIANPEGDHHKIDDTVCKLFGQTELEVDSDDSTGEEGVEGDQEFDSPLFVDRRVEIKWGDGSYEGTIMHVEQSAGVEVFTVRYDDGDQRVYSHYEVGDDGVARCKTSTSGSTVIRLQGFDRPQPVLKMLIGVIERSAAAPYFMGAVGQANGGKILGTMLTGAFAEHQDVINDLALFTKVCGSVSNRIWNNGVRMLIRALAKKLKCKIIVPDADALAKAKTRLLSVRALTAGRLDTAYVPGEEEQPDIGITLVLDQQITRRLDDKDELAALVLGGAIGTIDDPSGRGNSPENPVLIVGGVDQTKLSNAAGVDQLKIEHTAMDARIAGAQPHSNAATMHISLWKGDDVLTHIVGHGQCDGTCAVSQCGHHLAQLARFKVGTTVVLANSRIVHVKMIYFLTDGKSYRTILERMLGLAGWIFAYAEGSSATKEQVQFILLSKRLAQAAAPPAEIEGAAVDGGAAVSSSDARAARIAARDASAAAAAEQRIRFDQTGLLLEDMKELHFYALPLVHNLKNRARYIADGGSHKDIYCTGPLNEVFGGTDWVVHGAFRDIGNTNYLSLSLSYSRHYLLPRLPSPPDPGLHCIGGVSERVLMRFLERIYRGQGPESHAAWERHINCGLKTKFTPSNPKDEYCKVGIDLQDAIDLFLNNTSAEICECAQSGLCIEEEMLRTLVYELLDVWRDAHQYLLYPNWSEHYSAALKRFLPLRIAFAAMAQKLLGKWLMKPMIFKHEGIADVLRTLDALKLTAQQLDSKFVEKMHLVRNEIWRSGARGGGYGNVDERERK